jgi:hypothetical protein
MTNSSEINKDKMKRVRNTYPIYMDKDLINKVRDWQEQVKKYFNGLVTVTVSDVCSELLFQSSEQLSLNTLKSIEVKKLDPVKKLKLLLNKAIAANKNDEGLCLQDLIDENSSLLGLKSKKKAKVRVKKANMKSSKNTLNNSGLEDLDE